MESHISAQLEFDLRTGLKTAIGRGKDCDSLRSACAELNRERAEGILKAAAFAVKSPEDDLAKENQLSTECAKLEVPLVQLEDLGITTDIYYDLKSRDLIALHPGAEAKPYHDQRHDVVYKLYKVGCGLRTGRKCIIIRTGEDENPGLLEEERYRVGESEASLRDTIVKLALLNEVGALPTELVGLSGNGIYLVVKQPFAQPSRNPFPKDFEEVIRLTKAVKSKSMGLNCAILWLKERAFIVSDLRRENIMKDRNGSPSIIDALVGEIPASFISKFPALKADIDNAEDLRNGKIPRHRSHLSMASDDEL